MLRTLISVASLESMAQTVMNNEISIGRALLESTNFADQKINRRAGSPSYHSVLPSDPIRYGAKLSLQ